MSTDKKSEQVQSEGTGLSFENIPSYRSRVRSQQTPSINEDVNTGQATDGGVTTDGQEPIDSFDPSIEGAAAGEAVAQSSYDQHKESRDGNRTPTNEPEKRLSNQPTPSIRVQAHGYSGDTGEGATRTPGSSDNEITPTNSMNPSLSIDELLANYDQVSELDELMSQLQSMNQPQSNTIYPVGTQTDLLDKPHSLRTSTASQPVTRPKRTPPIPKPRTRKFSDKAEPVKKTGTGGDITTQQDYDRNQGLVKQIRTTEMLTRPMDMGGARPKQNLANTGYSEQRTHAIRSQVDQSSTALVQKNQPVLKLRPQETNKTENKRPFQLNNSFQAPAVLNAASEREAMNKYRVCIQKAKLLERNGNLAGALAEFKQGLQFQIMALGENNIQVAKTRGLIGRIYLKEGQHLQGVQEMEKELEIFRQLGHSSATHPDDFWVTHDSLAQGYDGVGDIAMEIHHYNEAINILMASATVPPDRLPHMHNNLGNAYRNAGDLNKALEHLQEAKRMMTLLHGYDPVEEMAKVHASLGDVYKDLQRIPEAIHELEACITIRKKTRPGADGDIIRGATHQSLSKLYEQTGDLEKSQQHKDASEKGLQGLMGSEQQRDEIVKGLQGLVKGNPSGMLNKLAAGLTASGDIAKAQQYQAENNNKEAITNYEKGIASLYSLPEHIQNSEEIQSTLALCHNNVGNAYRKTSQINKAQENLEKALAIRRRLFADEASDETASTLFNLGHLLVGIGGRANTQKAIDLHVECLQMYGTLGGLAITANINWIISLHRSLGQCYERLDNSRKSCEHYEEAKRIIIEKRPEDIDELRAVCNNMGNSYETLGDFENAKLNLETGLNLAVAAAADRPNDLDIQNHIAAGHNNLGVLYQHMSMYNDSLYHLKESQHVRERICELSAEAAQDLYSSYHNIGNTYVKMGQLREALEYYKKELSHRQAMGEDTTDVKVTMSHVYEQLGDVVMAQQMIEDIN